MCVRRFPGPLLKAPPTSPPHPGMGVVGGSRWDDWRAGCPPAAPQPMCQLAWRSGCSEGAEHLELRRLRGRRDRQAQRLARRSSRSDHFKSGPASGLAGSRGGDLAGGARSAADHDRPVRQAGRSRAAGLARTAGPGGGKGRVRSSSSRVQGAPLSTARPDALSWAQAPPTSDQKAVLRPCLARRCVRKSSCCSSGARSSVASSSRLSRYRAA